MSVRKREWTTSKGEAKTAWVVDYVDGAGKRRLKTFAKKKEADQFAASATVEISQGVHVPDSATVTITEAGKLWIKSGEADGLERTSIDQRQQHLDLHLTPYVGTVKLSKVTVPFVRELQDQWRAAGMSAAMVKRVTVSLGSILGDAQARGLASRNAVHESSRKRGGKRQQEKRQKVRLEYGRHIPTLEEIGAIVRAAKGHYRPMLIVAIFTGLRSSEFRAIRWSDIDFAKAQLHVRQRVDRYGTFGMPKSEASQRMVPLTPLVLNTLREWKLSNGGHELVFTNSAGNVEPHSNALQRGLWPTLIAAGVTRVGTRRRHPDEPELRPKYSGFHALRHWYASWCITPKADGGLELSPKAVQTRMGHSSIAITFDVYGHLFPVVDEQQAMAEAERRLLALNAT
jgi:integrase